MEPEPDTEDDPEETIEPTVWGIWVEQGPERRRKQGASELFVALSLAEDFIRGWKGIKRYLGNLW